MDSHLVPFRRLVLALLASLACCGAFAASASAAPIGFAGSSTLGFPPQIVGGSSSASISIENQGPGVATVDSAVLGGTNAGDFQITGTTCPQLLPEAQACGFTIRFEPQAGGARSATLTVSAEGQAPLVATLEGQAFTQVLTPPGPQSFSLTSVGSSTSLSFPLTNNSETNVAVSDLKIEGADPSDFSLQTNACQTILAPTQSCPVSVGFSPSAPGPRNAFLKVVSDGTPGTFLIPLSGEGAPVQLAFEPGSFDFGLREVHSGENEGMLVLRNIGAASVPLSAYETVGADPDEFWTSSPDCGGANLAPNQTCTLQVRFNANDEGSFSAAVRVTANGVSFEAPLSARAERPRIDISPAPFAFGQTTVGSPQIRQLTLTNSGNLPVGYFIAIVSGGDVSSFAITSENCTGRIIDPGQSCTVQVRFAPAAAGAKQATLGFFGNSEGPMQVPVTGTAVAPQVSLSPSERDFGAVAVGAPANLQSFQLRNESASAYDVQSVGLGGADLGEFAIAADACTEAVLQPDESCVVAVRFAPTTTGAKQATLRVRGSAGATIARLSGEGTATSKSGESAPPANGRVVLQRKRGARARGAQVTLGRARCESAQACTVVLRGPRPLAPVRLSMPAGASRPLTISLPPARRGAKAAPLRFTLNWRTGDRQDSATWSLPAG